ncbi:MAG: 30S ribosomal protein THX [Bacteroidetes bacterium]|nr:30S ribosomal protein THX [Bacteroidota bacterium]
MGKGDRKSKRGKIWRGSHGKSRPKSIKKKKTEGKSKEKSE